jgi:hypothetical protein
MEFLADLVFSLGFRREQGIVMSETRLSGNKCLRLPLRTCALVVALLGGGTRALAQNIEPRLLISGNGSQSTSFATLADAPTMGAALQVSRDTSGTGNQQGAALDLYAGGHGQALRVWVDSSSFKGGKAPGLTIDNGAGLRLFTYEVISGHPNLWTSNPFGIVPIEPTTDPSMLAIWADVDAPALVVAPNSGTSPGAGNFQDAAFLDGRGYERLAIDGAGTLQWSGQVANSYGGSVWDTKLARTAPGMLRTQGLQVTAMLQNAAYTFGNLPNAGSLANGTQVYCADCLLTSTNGSCSGGGSGAMAFVIGHSWMCN